MILKLICSISLIISSSFLFAQSEGDVVDKIVAQVGDNIILLSDIEAQKQQAIAAGITSGMSMDCEILEELMYQELLINQAKLDSLVVTDEQVDSEMENRIRVLEQQIGSREKMEAFYGKTVGQIKDEFPVPDPSWIEFHCHLYGYSFSPAFVIIIRGNHRQR